MTQQVWLDQLKKSMSFSGTQFEKDLIEIAKNSYDAGFKEGMDTANEIYTKVSNLLNK